MILPIVLNPTILPSHHHMHHTLCLIGLEILDLDKLLNSLVSITAVKLSYKTGYCWIRTLHTMNLRTALSNQTIFVNGALGCNTWQKTVFTYMPVYCLLYAVTAKCKNCKCSSEEFHIALVRNAVVDRSFIEVVGGRRCGRSKSYIVGTYNGSYCIIQPLARSVRSLPVSRIGVLCFTR